jgi:hypothetical protein
MSALRLSLAVILMIGGSTISSHATTLPQFDVGAFCEDAAKNDNSIEARLKPSFISLCKLADEGYLAPVQRKWTYVPERIQGDCLDIAKSSYERLDRCLERALDVYPASMLPAIFDLQQAGSVTRRFWSPNDCLAARQEGSVCVQR